jgi:hypothetical protein
VLNGGEGMEDLLAKAMTMGGAGLGLAQSLIASITGSSTSTTDTADTTSTQDASASAS